MVSWRRGLPFFTGWSEKASMMREYLRIGLNGSEGGSHVTYLGKMVPKQRDQKSDKVLRQECAWHNVRNSRKASLTEWDAAGGSRRGDQRDSAGAVHMAWKVKTWTLLWVRWEVTGEFWADMRHDLTDILKRSLWLLWGMQHGSQGWKCGHPAEKYCRNAGGRWCTSRLASISSWNKRQGLHTGLRREEKAWEQWMMNWLKDCGRIAIQTATVTSSLLQGLFTSEPLDVSGCAPLLLMSSFSPFILFHVLWLERAPSWPEEPRYLLRRKWQPTGPSSFWYQSLCKDLRETPREPSVPGKSVLYLASHHSSLCFLNLALLTTPLQWSPICLPDFILAYLQYALHKAGELIVLKHTLWGWPAKPILLPLLE